MSYSLLNTGQRYLLFGAPDPPVMGEEADLMVELAPTTVVAGKLARRWPVGVTLVPSEAIPLVLDQLAARDVRRRVAPRVAT